MTKRGYKRSLKAVQRTESNTAKTNLDSYVIYVNLFWRAWYADFFQLQSWTLRVLKEEPNARTTNFGTDEERRSTKDIADRDGCETL